MSSDSLDPREEVEKLREELQRVQLSKYELLRQTSAEIDRLRQTIKVLMGKADINSISSIKSKPLSPNEANEIINRVHINHPSIDFDSFFEQQQANFERSVLNQARASTDESKKYKNDNENENKNDINNENDRNEYETKNEKEKDRKNDNNYNENNYDNRNNNSNNNNRYNNNDENENDNRYLNNDKEKDNRLSTIHEDTGTMSDESNSSSNNKNKNQNERNSHANEQLDEIQKKVARISSKINDRDVDSSYRLSIKRMSRQGFVFSDLGFMTTDFEQLQRGHTQWVNHCIHHPIQNGICISASNDSCIFFWRFRESTGKEDLMQEKYDSLIDRFKNDHNQQKAIILDAKSNKPNIQSIHSPGEIKLHPLLKINTGLQIKGIGMSKNGSILACTCYDEEEEDNEPELELYYDDEQYWMFEQDFNYDNGLIKNTNSTMSNNNKDRTIHRKVIGLPFPPIERCVEFTHDGKFVFVAMDTTKEDDDRYSNDDGNDGKEKITMVCIDVTTKMVRGCDKINNIMISDETVRCFSISPDGQRIAIGTSFGRLIVTGVRALTGVLGEPDGNESANLWRIWVDQDSINGNNSNNNINNNNNGINQLDDDGTYYNNDGGLSAVCWSADCEWLITGYYSGSIKLWKKNKEPRLSINVNKVVSIMMKRANVARKSKIFTCKWMLEGLHVESINSFSIEGSLLVSGSDDGTIIVHDLCQTFVDDQNINNIISTNINNNNNNNRDRNNDNGNNNAPSTLAKIERLHGGRMVTSVGLSTNYGEQSVLVPTAGLFMVSSGADNVIHCLSLLGVLRHSIRSKFYNQKL